jgi:2-polyprenyl-6-methoxyphenol hydroxylase-like FAD-dependent oxidoreductase
VHDERVNESRVGVVGFGVAGATVASLLARQGHHVTVFERTPDHAVGAGLLLQPSGQLVLDRLGILAEIARSSERIEEIVGVTARGRGLVRLAYAELGPDVAGLGVFRPFLLETLDRMALAAGVAVRRDTEITALHREATKITLEDRAGQRHGPFDLVVGADGLRSAIRRLAGLQRWMHGYGYGALWTVGRTAAVQRELRMITRGTRDLLGLLPLGAGVCNFFWSQRHDRWDATRARGFAAWRDDVLSLSPLAEEVIGHVRGFDDLMLTSYGHVVTHPPHDARVVLLGDAAHAMSPHLGQGVNFALVDAYEFARSFAETGDVSTAISRYMARRHRQTRYYAWLTLGLTPFFQSGGYVKGTARDLGLPIIQRLPYVRGRMILSMAGLSGGFRGDRFTLR